MSSNNLVIASLAFALVTLPAAVVGEAGCDGQWSEYSVSSSMVAQTFNLHSCTWSSSTCINFSYELEDLTEDDSIDVIVTDGQDCLTGTGENFNDRHRYVEHLQDDMSMVKSYDKHINNKASKFCIIFKCDNPSATCDRIQFRYKMEAATCGSSSSLVSSPPPPSTSSYLTPPPSTSSYTSSESCKCTCCTGNYCSASIVGSYNAPSSDECLADSCRDKFSNCPASGMSGKTSASYSPPPASYVTPPSMGLQTGHTLTFVSSSSACSSVSSPCEYYCDSAGFTITKVSDTSYLFLPSASFPSGIDGCDSCPSFSIEGELSGSGTSSTLTGTMKSGSNEITGAIAREDFIYAVSTTAEPGCAYTYSNPALASASSRSAGSRSAPALFGLLFTLMSLALTAFA